ncbi:hypothetical protein [Sphingomonas sp. JC676]|uniref:hypothetical protein n=1 Tax=Sphingomonas sp. JC676 TaxID=2768065 RepID=UPI001CA7B42F
MLLTTTTTHRPATDLGFLLMKNPANVHAVALPLATPRFSTRKRTRSAPRPLDDSPPGPAGVRCHCRSAG